MVTIALVTCGSFLIVDSADVNIAFPSIEAARRAYPTVALTVDGKYR